MDIPGLVAVQKMAMGTETVTEVLTRMGTLGMVMEMVMGAMALTVVTVAAMVVMGAAANEKL
tara:strand:- start:3722 stop:3907 length:186 start_codon:yes stop_codon:yes gene_type:complete